MRTGPPHPYKFLILFFAALLPALGVAAGEPRGVTLTEALASAQAGNALLQAARLEVEASEGQLREARSHFAPDVDLSASFLRTTNPVYVFMGKLGQRAFTIADFEIGSLNRPAPYNNWQSRAEVTVPLFTGGKLVAGHRAAKLGVEAARGSSSFAESAVVKAVTEAFYGSLLAGQAAAVTAEAVKTAEAHRGQVAAMRTEGMALDSDLLRMEVYAADLEQQLVSREADAQVARAYLAYAMGEEGDVEPRGGFAFPDAAPPFLEDAEELAAKQRGDLLAMELQARQAGEGVKMAMGGFMPQVGAMASWEWNTESFGALGSNWAVGLQVKLPLFDGGARSGRLQTTRAREGQARLALLDMRQKVLVEVKEAWLRSRAAAERVSVTADAAAQSRENLRIVELRYTEGLASITDLLDADTALLAAELNRAQALHDGIVTRARLSWAMGEK